jgi:uncharacterized protein
MIHDEQWAARRQAILAGRHWSSPNGLRPRWHHGAFSLVLEILGRGLQLTPWYARGVRNALDLELTRLELKVTGLPAVFDGYRILHVSDSHLDVLPSVADAAARLLDGLEVDLLAVTGDVHGRKRHPLSRSVEPLKRALAGVIVRDRRLAVLGNHDPVEMIEALGALGIETLVNRTTALSRGGEVLHVTGLDDVHNFYSPAARTALDQKVDGCRIALVHSAEMADHAAAAGCALYLCGHTHAGQVCLHAASGVWREGAMVGYTSPGLGVSPPAVRFNSRGGAALITLRR